MVFTAGTELTAVTRGPGSIHLLSWQNNAKGVNTVGAIPTTKAGLTRWVISFSHHYERFAFIWSGEGEAVYQIGSGLERKPVGRKWESASTYRWGAAAVTTENVTEIVPTAVNRDNVTTVFVIPDTL